MSKSITTTISGYEFEGACSKSPDNSSAEDRIITPLTNPSGAYVLTGNIAAMAFIATAVTTATKQEIKHLNDETLEKGLDFIVDCTSNGILFEATPDLLSTYTVTNNSRFALKLESTASGKKELKVLDNSFLGTMWKTSLCYKLTISNNSKINFYISPSTFNEELTYTFYAPANKSYQVDDIYKTFKLLNYLTTIDWKNVVTLGTGGTHPNGPFVMYLQNNHKTIINKMIVDNADKLGGLQNAQNLISNIENFVYKNFLQLAHVCKKVTTQNSDSTDQQLTKNILTLIPYEIFSHLSFDDSGMIVAAMGDNDTQSV